MGISKREDFKGPMKFLKIKLIKRGLFIEVPFLTGRCHYQYLSIVL